jgi:DNA-binding beta-propeller fold protein YncE
MSSVGNNLPSAFSISSETAQEKAFTEFETGQVRPLALSGDGQFLYATNTPDNRLEIFKIKGAGLHHLSSVPVGLEPLAVAEHKSGEVWVVNHLSDSVSIVNVSDPGNAFVTHTLLVATNRGTSSSPARIDRAPSSPPRIAVKTPGATRSLRPPVSDEPMCGCSMRQVWTVR